MFTKPILTFQALKKLIGFVLHTPVSPKARNKGVDRKISRGVRATEKKTKK